MHSTSQQKSEDQERKVVKFGSTSTNPKIVDNNLANSTLEQTTSPSSYGDCWKSEYLHDDFDMEDSKEFLQMARIKKSRSLGSILDKERGFTGGDVDDDEVEPLQRNTSPELYNHENIGINFDDQHSENGLVEPFDMIADHAHHDSLFSIEVLKQFDGKRQSDGGEQSTKFLADSGGLSPDNHPDLATSQSVTYLREDTEKPTEDTGIHQIRRRSRSFGNLHSINGETAEFHDGDEVLSSEVIHVRLRDASDSFNLPQESDEDRKGSPGQVDSGEEHHLSDTSGGLIEEQEAHGKYWGERFDCDNQASFDRYHSSDHLTSANERREPETGDENFKNLQPEYPVQNCDELNPKELHIRRIEEWISQIDVDGGIVEEPGETSCSFPSEEPQAEVSIHTVKVDAKSNLGMEVAYNYISSLNATSSSAQMVNLGLVAVPSLSAFTSLRVLNLSGNSIGMHF